MSTPIPNGDQSAFPVYKLVNVPMLHGADQHDVLAQSVGLTKREEFAKAIAQGMAASPIWCENFGTKNDPIEQAMRIAVSAADILLAELEKKP